MSYLGNLMNALVGRNPQASIAVERSQEKVYDLRNLTDDQVRELIRFGGVDSNTTMSGRNVTDHAAMRVAAVYRCTSLLQGVVGAMPRDMIRRVDERRREPAVNHPIRKLLTVAPNDWMTPKQFFGYMQVCLLHRGNAYARKVFGVGNRVVALLPLQPSKVRTETKNFRIRYYYMQDNGREIEIPKEEIFHVVGMSMDGFTGVSVLSYMREAIGLALDAQDAASSLMKNGAFVKDWIGMPVEAKLNQESYDRLRESWAEYRSAKNAGKTPILEQGATYHQESITADDLQFLQQRDFQRYDIAMFYGVPPHLIGATEKTTSWGNGIEQQNIGFVTYSLNDWLVTWQETIKRDLFLPAEQEEYDFRFYTQSLLKGDVKTQWEAFAKGRQWNIYSPNDVRALLDENPREDADGDDYGVPPNQTKDSGAPGDGNNAQDQQVDPNGQGGNPGTQGV